MSEEPTSSELVGEPEAPPTQPAVGWYPHPAAPGWEAYWDGTMWGAETRRAEGAVSASPDQAPPAQDPAAEHQPSVGAVPAERTYGLLAIIFSCVAGIVAIAAIYPPTDWMRPIDAVGLMAGGSALVATCGLAIAILRIQGTAAALAAMLVIAATMIVSISLALSLFEAYNRWAMVASQLVILTLVAGLWILSGRPRPLVRLPRLSELRKAASTHPYIAAILLALAFASMVEAVLALGVVPNNYDSMFYHLSRIGYWMQNDSVFQFYGGTVFQLQHPPNAEILQAWTMEVTQGDRFAQLVQWSALAGLACVIYAGARFLSFSRAGSLFAAAVFATLPLPVLQASSTQNDLVAAFFVCAAALFLTRSVRETSVGDGIVGALALGLAVGTKGTVLFAIPGLALLLAAALWRWRPPTRFIAGGSAVLVLAMLVLGVQNHAETTSNAGSPFGAVGTVKERTDPIPESAAKTLWGFVDLPGKNSLPVLPGLLASGDRAAWGIDAEKTSLDRDVHEDYTGFGPIGLLLLLPLLAVTLARRENRGDRRLLAAAALSYIALFLLLVTAQPFDMRLMIIPVALSAPLFAFAADVTWLRRLTVLVAVALLVPVLFANQQKPLQPGDFSLGKNLVAQRTGSNSGFEEMLYNTEQAVLGDRRVGFVGTPYDWDYPLFGPRLDRQVVRLPESISGSEARAAIDDYGLDSIVWAIEPPSRTGASLVSDPDLPKRGTMRWVQEGNP